MNDTPALSATLESVLIRKPLAKHVLDLRVKSEMMTKNRFSDGFTGWSSPVGSSMNNCVAIVVQKRRDVSNSAQGEGRRSSRRVCGAQDPRTTSMRRQHLRVKKDQVQIKGPYSRDVTP